MPLLHAIVLGIVQGLSEFLPISSSGHLILVPWLFGWNELVENPELNRSFDVALHVGTLLALLVYFRRDLLRLAVAGVRSVARRRIDGPDERLAWLLVVASVPAATVGLVLDSLLEGHSGGEAVIGVMLIVFGLVLLVADRAQGRRAVDAFRFRDAAVMGVAQAIALQPGVSRSGATISVGRWLGFERDAAARISFLMTVPITAGLGVYKAVDVFVLGEGLPPGFAAPFAWGTATAAVTGFLAVWGLLRLIRTRSFAPFVVYRVLVGTAVIAVALARG
ncbi:MAG: undecaprenyl-diphosphate phosphatase [Actinobacteria bacterium]|nr:undecaprenyl-diphosphate phosphatase [Actinomycetota bacterium]MBW3650627.1 undecaprenyl-diphosphate phosphatase [Actinomycetota bacterium]